ncbi:MAG: hypothetical protein ABW157_09295 [Candidatus Thiodiazotropha sp. LLP2]
MSRKSRIGRVAKQQAITEPKQLTDRELRILGIAERKHFSEEEPHINLKYFDPSYECFSTWNQQELCAFSNLLRKLAESDWTSINNSGGKRGKKSGFGYTLHKSTVKLPCTNPRLSKLSPEINFSELRVTKKARIHGFRIKEAFFLVWLDRNHQICPE